MDQAVAALIAHLDSQASKYGVQSVKLYAGEFADADQIDNILPAILIIPPTLETVRTHDRFEFSLLICTENIFYARGVNAEENLLLGWRVYHWLKNHDSFGDGLYRYSIGMPFRASIAAFTHRHIVVELEFSLWKR